MILMECVLRVTDLMKDNEPFDYATAVEIDKYVVCTMSYALLQYYSSLTPSLPGFARAAHKYNWDLSTTPKLIKRDITL